jgi:hypothetical protein
MNPKDKNINVVPDSERDVSNRNPKPYQPNRPELKQEPPPTESDEEDQPTGSDALYDDDSASRKGW